MRKLVILLVVLVIAAQAFAQNEIHLLKSDSVFTFKKIRILRGGVKCYPFEKGKPAVNFENSQIAYMNWKGRHWGPSNNEFFKVHDTLFTNEMYRQGALDACRNYNKYYGAAAGTFCTTFFTGAILGLIPAISTSATSPKAANLNIPDTKLKDDAKYLAGYKKQARNMKSGRVWSNYGLGIEWLLVLGVTINLVTLLATPR